MDEWRAVGGYEGGYEVSALGATRSLGRVVPHPVYGEARRQGRALLGWVDSCGYRRVSLCGKQAKVHRLVAAAFVQNPLGKPHVNHIDGVKLNNEAVNLECVTQAENQRHAGDNGLMRHGERHHRSKLTCVQVVEIRQRVSVETQSALAREFGVHPSVVSRIASGESWRHVGE